MSGINVRFNRLLGFVLSGFCSSVAGIVLTSAVLSANATQGSTYLMDAFGACFIGAATVRIGQFHIWGTLVGVMIVVVAINGLIIMMVPGYYTSMIQGVILLLAILLSSTGTRLLKK
jgi:ribose transport system permease protein